MRLGCTEKTICNITSRQLEGITAICMGNCYPVTVDNSDRVRIVRDEEEEHITDEMATSSTSNSVGQGEGLGWLIGSVKNISNLEKDVHRAIQQHKELLEEYTRTKQENSSLRTRLGKYSEKEVNQDLSGKIENIQRKSRQSILKTVYYDFHDHARVDAIFEIENCRKVHNQSDRMTEIEDRWLASFVLEVAYRKAYKACNTFLRNCPYFLNSASSVGIRLMAERDSIENISESVASNETKDIQFQVRCNLPDSSCELSPAFNDAMHSELGEMSEESDIRELIEITQASVTKALSKEKINRQNYHMDHLKEKIQKYIEKCARLCWRLVTHNPPLKIIGSNPEEKEMFDPKRHELCKDLNSGVQKSLVGPSYIEQIIWPALADYRGKILVKAEVILDDSAV